MQEIGVYLGKFSVTQTDRIREKIRRTQKRVWLDIDCDNPENIYGLTLCGVSEKDIEIFKKELIDENLIGG